MGDEISGALASREPLRRTRRKQRFSATKNSPNRFAQPGILKTVLIGVLSLISLGSWAVASPLGSTPDSLFHTASIWCSDFVDDNPCDRTFDDTPSWGIPSGLVGAMCAVQNPTRSASCQPFIHLSDGSIERTADLNPASGFYPELFYKTMNLFVGPNIEHSVVMMRLFNSFLFTVIFLSLGFLLSPRLKNSMVLMWLVSIVPVGIFFIASLNPSSWTIIGVAGAWLSMMGFLESRGWRSPTLATIFVLSATLAIGSRSEAPVYVIIAILLAVWLSDWSSRATRVKLGIGALSSGIIAGILLYNPRQAGVAAEGFGQRPSDEEMPRPAPDSAGGVLWVNLLDVPSLWLGIIGGYPLGSLGWLDTVMPQVVVLGIAITLISLAYLSLRESDWKKITAVVGGFVVLGFIPIYLLQLGSFLVGEEIQPRYIYPLFLLLVGAIMLRSEGQRAITISRPTLWVFSALLAVAFSAALHTNIRRYVTGTTKGGIDLNAEAEWWWRSIPEFLSPTFAWALGSVSFMTLAFLLLQTFAKTNKRSGKIVPELRTRP
jgi:hypothetical protein